MILCKEAGILGLIAPDQADRQEVAVAHADKWKLAFADKCKVVCLPNKIPIGYWRRYAVAADRAGQRKTIPGV